MSLKQNIFAIFIILISALYHKSYSQEPMLPEDNSIEDKTYAYDALKLNPMALFVGPTMITSEVGLIYDFSLSQRRSVAIGASWLAKNVFIYLTELASSQQSSGHTDSVVYVTPDLKISGWRIQGHYKFLLPSNNYPSAFHVGPHASYSRVYFGDAQNGFNRDYYRIVHRNISILAGYQFAINNKVFLDIYNGIGYKNNFMVYHKTPSDYKTIEEDDFFFTGIPINIKFSLGFSIGIMF